MQPLSLADRVLAALPSFTDAPLARDMAARLNTDEPHVRLAFERLESEGKARIVRRGRGLHLVPADYPGLICVICRAEFTRGKKSKRRACSRACWISLGWKETKDREGRVAAIGKSRRSPESRAKAVEVNHKRWRDPKQRERLSNWNRERWADPVTKMELSVAIQREHSTPEKRALYGRNVKARWDDPAGRKKLVDGIKASKNTPEAKAKFSKLLSDRWKDPEMRAKYTAANRARNDKRFSKKP